MARPNVPEFGNWPDEGSVPCTLYFEEAGKKKGGKMTNPNNPGENPELFANATSSSAPGPTPAPRPRPRAQNELIGRGAIKAKYQPGADREDSEVTQFADSPARPGAGNDSPHQQTGSHRIRTRSVRYSMPGGGSGRTGQPSPAHPSQQVRPTWKDNGPVAPEGKRPNERIQGTPGRSSRMTPHTRDDANNEDVAIPPFGEWDVKDPKSADQYTGIFNRHRTGTMPGSNSALSRNTNPNQNAKNNVKFSLRWCFSSCRK